jgi:hypothetical protein
MILTHPLNMNKFVMQSDDEAGEEQRGGDEE